MSVDKELCPKCWRETWIFDSFCENCGINKVSWKKLYGLIHDARNDLCPQAPPSSQVSTTAKRDMSKNEPKGVVSKLLEKVMNSLLPCESAPSLRTLNGFGHTLFGSLPLDENGRYELKATFICFFFIPLIPTGIYLVEEMRGTTYRFYGRLPFSHFMSIFGSGEACFFLGSIELTSAGMILALALAFTFASFVFGFIRK